MEPNHTSGAVFDVNNPPMTSRLVKFLMLEHVRDNPLINAKNIIDHFRMEYGVLLKYYFAWSGKELAIKEIHGGDTLSYHQLVWFVDSLLKTNPGSHVALESDPITHKFERIFISFEACISGFKYCRPMVALDGTFLKGKFKGWLLSATAKNGNQGMQVFSQLFLCYIQVMNLDVF
ncbi:Zinc finger protein [Thalictrum thalictroides]|uniref:Zinc finger protein n=1 Tax=Thalictrum thalictroides TaxID=46969 RepID=A0A7J6VJS4_THATH|nr:Zinc finger protein [Thalictrum thalictroides]